MPWCSECLGPKKSAAPYERSFFARAPDTVAKELLGSFIEVRTEGNTVHARILETEAYGGRDDPASHAYRGPTPRSSIMFGPAGHLYVYLSYGVHWCMNVVTETNDVPSAVLLRAIELHEHNDRSARTRRVVRGPGRLTKALGITGVDNGVDCCLGKIGRLSFWPARIGDEPFVVERSARIGVSSAKDRLSRYSVTES